MATYTLHVTFTAPDDDTAVYTGRIVTRDIAEGYQCVRDADAFKTWDVSGADHTGAQDWSLIVPRVVPA